MFSFLAHGLIIHSPIKLSSIPSDLKKADLIIKYGKVDFTHDGSLNNGIHFAVYPDFIYLHWDEVGKFKLIDGRFVIMDLFKEAREGIVRQVIMGPVLATILHQRGRLVLHSSAIETDEGVVCFLGQTGQGKSTLALTLYRMGYPIISDDVLGVTFKEHVPMAYPGFPYLRLDKEDFLEYESLQSDEYKNYYKLSDGYSPNKKPVRAIYVLQDSFKSEIQNLKPQIALMELLSNSYTVKLMRDNQKPYHLSQCAEIVRKIPVKSLKMERSLNKLPEVCKMLIRNFN